MERGVVKHIGVNPAGTGFGFIVPEDGGSAVYFNQKGGLFVLITSDNEPRFGRRSDNLRGCRWLRSPFPTVNQSVLFVRQTTLLGPRAEAWCEEQCFRQLVAEQAGQATDTEPVK